MWLNIYRLCKYLLIIQLYWVLRCCSNSFKGRDANNIYLRSRDKLRPHSTKVHSGNQWVYWASLDQKWREVLSSLRPYWQRTSPIKAFQKTDSFSPNLSILYTLILPKNPSAVKAEVHRKHGSGWLDTMRGMQTVNRCSWDGLLQTGTAECPKMAVVWLRGYYCTCVLDARRQRHTLRLSSCVLLWQPLNCLVHLQQWLGCQSVISCLLPCEVIHSTSLPF